MLESLLQFGGRLHPMILHAPIGLMIGLVFVEAVGLARARPLGREVRLALVWLTVISAGASIATGLLLNRAGGYPSGAAGVHQWVAIGAGTSVLLAAIAAQARSAAAYGFFLLVGAGLLIPAGHLGAGMTHGEDFLFEPFRPARETGPIVPASGRAAGEVTHPASAYARLIAPILEDHCYSCHGPAKRKGGLSLHTPQFIIAGGDSGVPIVPGDPEASDLVRRLRLPIDDDEHMPPRSKDQLQPGEKQLLEAWIRAGASFESEEDPALAPSERSSSEPVVPATSVVAASPEAIAALRDHLVHVEPVSRESPLLVIDAAAVAGSLGDAEVESLLRPVAGQVSDLSLARSKVSDQSMDLITALPHLRRLNLSATSIGDAGVARLSEHAALEELIITQTAVTDAGLAAIARAPKLKSIYLWACPVTPGGLAAVRHDHEDIDIDAGDVEPAQPIATEPDVVLKDSAVAVDLRPVNATCPVSGKPVDAAYAVVHRGKVVGFCCPRCVGQFLEEPSKYEANIN